jgi:hypothetical protein
MSRQLSGIWDIKDRAEVVMPPSSSAAYEHWTHTAPVHEVNRWVRTMKTVQFVEACMLNGERMGLGPDETIGRR